MGLGAAGPAKPAGCGRQIPAQRLKLAVGAGGQGLLQALIEFLRRQPALTRRYPEQFGDPVPVLVRGTQMIRGAHLITMARRRRFARHGHTLRRDRPPGRGECGGP